MECPNSVRSQPLAQGNRFRREGRSQRFHGHPLCTCAGKWDARYCNREYDKLKARVPICSSRPHAVRILNRWPFIRRNNAPSLTQASSIQPATACRDWDHVFQLHSNEFGGAQSGVGGKGEQRVVAPPWFKDNEPTRFRQADWCRRHSDGTRSSLDHRAAN